MARRGWHRRRRCRRRRRLASTRALVLVDISNSYVISWVLLGAPESCYYLPLLSSANADTRGERGGWRRPSTSARYVLQYVLSSRAFCSLSTRILRPRITGYRFGGMNRGGLRRYNVICLYRLTLGSSEFRC